MPTEYYLCKDGQRTGPFLIEQMRSMWQSGGITSDSFYWIECMPEWKAISEIAPTLQVQPPKDVVRQLPPPQPKTELIPVGESLSLRPRIVSASPKHYELSIADNGAIDFSSDTLGGAKEGLEQLKLSKKSFQLKKKELQIKARQIRQQYTGYTRSRVPMVRGGGVIGLVIRDFQSVSHSTHRNALAEALRPIEGEINHIDRILLNLESIITQVKFKIQNFRPPSNSSAS